MSELAFDGTPLHTLLAEDTAPTSTAAPAPGAPALITATGTPRASALLLTEQIQRAHAAVLAAHHAIARHQVRLAGEGTGTGHAR
ncbi:hypothetical protein NX794_17810 [Streptomyces sp. LP11]|uniref:Uncharacterized protein n=1 Tax=Streptomyces pyxinicus TaxID=2970331 RepID=A0ABT2B3G2_9ACTN|nr:hypothetical protein [Streptomyces sp. LP11]MCS0603054.1 hypothetical protein [Streptomyces sp. LP11]